MYTISFADKLLQIVKIGSAEHRRVESEAMIEGPKSHFTRAKILNFFETANLLVIATEEPDELFASLKSEFTEVIAAGGVAINARGERLLIHRNGRWDLPKGHLEAGESIRTCAQREVEEETGVEVEEIRCRLCDTWHAYFLYGRWELKHTFWYELYASKPSTLRPQTEEGIQRAEWCSPSDAMRHARESFPTIRAVFEALEAGKTTSEGK